MMPAVKQLALAACTILIPFISYTTASPLPLQTLQDDDIIPGKYIVTLNTGLTTANLSGHLNWVSLVHANSALGRRVDVDSGISSEFIISDWMGYSGHFDESTLAQIRSSPAVAYVEPNRYVYTQKLVGQKGSTWGLDSISHNDNKRRPAHTYVHDPRAGEGMWAYVIDSGVRVTHEDFEGRAVVGATMFTNVPHSDDRGHGTHVAGTIASKHYGVCKRCGIVSVKIFAGGMPTTMATAIEGLAWAVRNITDEGREGRAVINLSIGGTRSQALNDAIGAALRQGILTVAAAGNNGHDAARYSPSSAADAVIVAAVDKNHARVGFSNFGKTVDLFAPGMNVESLSHTGDAKYHSVMSGTSMASPHVAGLILYIKSVFEGTQTAAGTLAKLKELQRVGVVKDAHGSPNFLAYNGANTNTSSQLLARPS